MPTKDDNIKKSVSEENSATPETKENTTAPAPTASAKVASVADAPVSAKLKLTTVLPQKLPITYVDANKKIVTVDLFPGITTEIDDTVEIRSQLVPYIKVNQIKIIA